MIKEYKIYSDVVLGQLETSVNISIKEGWQPLGGVSITRERLNSNHEPDKTGEETVIYIQAMGR